MRSIRMIAPRSFVVLAVLLSAVAAARGQENKSRPSNQPAASGEPADPTLEELLVAHNKVRAEEKRGPLKLNARLTEAARVHARDMADHDELAHEGSDGSTPKQRIQRARYAFKAYGENVASGQDTVVEVMRTWIESPGHRENILGDFTEMGGAVVKSFDGRKFWCVDFGRPIPPVDPEKSPGELIDSLNRARAGAKKTRLKPDAVLARIASRFASQAAERKSLETKDRDGKTPFDVLKSEGYRSRRFAMSLAYGEGDPQKVVAAWLEENDDRESLLSPFDRVGVGVAKDSEGVPYWVLLLAQGAAR